MEYRKVREDFVIRLDKGEEAIERLTKFANLENIGCASVSAIGASDDFEIGVFDTASKTYAKENVRGDYEIVSLNGNITRNGGKPHLHLHSVLSDASGRVVAGHLFRLKVSVTCEIFVRVLDGEVTREFSESAGTSLMKISE